MFSTSLVRALPSAARTRMLAGAQAQAGRLFHSSPVRRVVHEIKTAEEFQKAISSNDRVLVDCFAEWCGPCKAIAPILAKSSEDPEFKDKIHFVKFDVDALPELTRDLGVRAMPTFVMFKDGKKVDEMVGANPPMLVEMMKKYNA